MAMNPPTNNNSSGLNLNQAVIDSSVIHTNVGQEIVVTTEDKLELCLRDHQHILKAKSDWITPLGLFIAVLTSLVAADFKEFLGISADLWNAIFLICSFIFGFWLLKALSKAFQYRGSGDTKEIIQKLKNNSQNLNP
ncbi:hypothetical protein [Peribacillus muralis]|uniref:hypothetical protein n=1 Tax=Peribacillus muralis TaxID=264697 RepID=UPI003D03FF3B